MTKNTSLDGTKAIRVLTEAEIARSTLLLHERLKQVVEPSGATALAAVLEGRAGGSDVGVVLSGGNVDIATLAALPDMM